MRDAFKNRKTIAKAVMMSDSDLPVDQEWYKNRIAKCSPCEYNSDNVPNENKTTSDQIREFVGKGVKYLGKRYCTICKCPIDEKAAFKNQACGISENKNLLKSGLKPKWSQIEIEDDTKMFFSVINLTPENCDLKRKSDRFVFDFGAVSKNSVELKFRIYSPYKCEFVTVNREDHSFPLDVQQGEDHMEISAVISTRNYRIDALTEKHFEYVFTQHKGVGKARFSIEITKKTEIED